MRHKVTLYDTLGVEQDATDKQIRVAFRNLALKHHPDRFSGEERDVAEEKFQGMTEAFNRRAVKNTTWRFRPAQM